MRLKSDFWVQAYIRQCNDAGHPAVLVRRGQADAGAIFIQLLRADGTTTLLGPAPAGLDATSTDRQFCVRADGAALDPPELSARMADELAFDRDLWIIEVEAREGFPCLDDSLVMPDT